MVSNWERAWRASAVVLLRDGSGDVLFAGQRIERRTFAEKLAATLDMADTYAGSVEVPPPTCGCRETGNEA